MTTQEPGAIVPRWEWRTFAPSLASIEARLPGLRTATARVSSEIYLLHLRGPQNMKIRGDMFDIKRLCEVDPHGLELWQPVFKAKFPLTHVDIAAVFAEWQIALPRLDRESYTKEQLIGELIGPQPALHVAPRVLMIFRAISLNSMARTGSGRRCTFAQLRADNRICPRQL
jgi:hypothetical protein